MTTLCLRSLVNQASRLGKNSRSSLSKKDVDVPAVKMFETQLRSPNTYRVMSALAFFQLPMWLYLSYFSYFELDPERLKKLIQDRQRRKSSDGNDNSSAAKIRTTDLESLKKLNSWSLSDKSRLFFSVLSLGAGLSFCSLVLSYQFKLVKSVTFIRASQTLHIVTGTPIGSLRTLKVPLTSVTCPVPLQKLAANQYIMLVVKGHRLKFLLNPKNAEINPWFQTLVLSRR